MAFTHVGHVIVGAMKLLRLLPPGDNPSTEDYADYVEAFNLMLKDWSTRKYLLPVMIQDENLSLPGGVSSRTIGPVLADYITARPIQITSAFIRDSSGLDYNFPKIGNKLEYSRIYNKSQVGKPCNIYYDPTYNTNGTIYFDRVTDAAYGLYLQSMKKVNEYADQNATLLEPPEYHAAMVYNLAVRISDQNSDALLTPHIVARAKETLDSVRRLKSVDHLEDVDYPIGISGDSYGGASWYE